MSVLRFASEEALRFVITSGLVPEPVLAGAAKTWRDDEGGILVAPFEAIAPGAMKKLAAAGVGRLPAQTTGKNVRAVRSWAELVAIEQNRPIEDVAQVLFRIPEGASLVDLAGELLRLGCDRLEWRPIAGGYLLRAGAPPFYSILRAVDGGTGIMAFVPTPRGQDRVFTEIGCEHALVRFLRPEDGTIVLVSRAEGGASSFETLPEGPFEDLYGLVDLAVPGEDVRKPLTKANEAPRLVVTLRLARAASSEAPALWVLRENAVAKVERLLASLPEEIARGLLFAPCREGEDLVVVLRSRSGAKLTVEIDGEGYRAHASIANLFLPCDATLEPPLRRDRVRELLTPDPDDVVWLRSLATGTSGSGFQVEQAPDAAFQPLTEWVDYVIDTHAALLVPWVKAATFDFDAFVGVDPGPDRAREEPPEEPSPKKKGRRAPEPEPAPRPVRTSTTRAAPERAAAPAPLVATRLDANRVAEELGATERRYLELDAPADAPERSELWDRMAPLNAALRRTQDAALCWARVAWEAEPQAAAAALSAWSVAERAAVHGASASTLLRVESPSREHVRTLAVLLASGSDDVQDLAQDASLWLDRHDDVLDLRTAWLARVAISRLVGGDRLGLARARDRLLGKIHRGLSLERDVPSFLRRAGAGRDVAQIELLAGKLDGLLTAFEKTKRDRKATEADPKLTGAYVRFIVAYGAARLGRVERAAELRDAAVKTLPRDTIHDLLSKAFVARIGQALEGLSAETPLPAEISSSLNALAKLDRYKVDRVRQCSKVLEPHERLDPIAAFQRGEADPRGPEFAELRGVSESAVIEKAVAQIMSKAKASTPDERARLYDGAMDFFPQIAHERACAHLEVILGNVDDVAPLRRAQLFEEALMLAGHFGEERLARKIFALLEPLVASIGPDGAAEIAPLASGMLRTLRRFGLRDEAERLLVALQAAAKGRATPHLVARLHTASALAYLGELDRARPVFEEALTALAGNPLMPERLQLVRALSRALSAAPLPYAMAGLEQIEKKLDGISDSFNTNTHVCLSVVDFMESLVLGYASEDLAIDHTARRFLDDDEYLVRRRIHRDLAR